MVFHPADQMICLDKGEWVILTHYLLFWVFLHAKELQKQLFDVEIAFEAPQP